MLHSDIDSLDIRYRQLTRDALADAKKIASVRVVETLREYLVQVAYFARSRAVESDVDFAYAQAGMAKPDHSTAVTKCTDTLNSNHLSGRAIDIWITKLDGSTADAALWKAVAKCFTSRGATWGLDWDRDGLTLADGDKDEARWIQDAPHFEWPA